MSSRRFDEDDWLELLGNVPIRFWMCPIGEHGTRTSPDGRPVVTVEWRGDTAHCTAPGCDETSKTENQETR